jgi:hypothetical protein
VLVSFPFTLFFVTSYVPVSVFTQICIRFVSVFFFLFYLPICLSSVPFLKLLFYCNWLVDNFSVLLLHAVCANFLFSSDSVLFALVSLANICLVCLVPFAPAVDCILHQTIPCYTSFTHPSMSFFYVFHIF